MKRRNHAIWLGPFVAFLGAVAYFSPWIVRVPALRDFPWINLPVVLAGLLLSLFGAWRAFSGGSLVVRLFSVAGLAVAAISSGLFCAYVFFLSNQLPAVTETTSRLREVPRLELLDQDGRSVNLGDYAGTKLILVFYRGHW